LPDSKRATGQSAVGTTTEQTGSFETADLDLLLHAARSAGDIALRFHGPDTKRWDKPDGAGPVTEADLAVNAELFDVLRGARPDYGWLSEETEDSDDRLTRDQVFIIDPIDGTRSFAAGSRTWALSLAVARHGQITAGVVYLPRRDMMFAAALGHGATLNGVHLQNLATPRDGGHTSHPLASANVLATAPTIEARHWKHGQAPTFTRAHRPSLAYRMAAVAEGRFDAMITLRPTWEWDIAAGSLILTEAGAHCTTRTGKPMQFNNRDPRLDGVVAGNHDVTQQILASLA
jgi:myo-inositol-1(or 4)-monophosphatase